MEEENTHMRFLHYEEIKKTIIEQIKQWCFENLIESIQSDNGKDMHEIVLDIRDASEEWRTIDMDFKVETGEKGVKIILNYRIL